MSQTETKPIEEFKALVTEWRLDANFARQNFSNAAMAVVGARQTGKTTFVENITKTTEYCVAVHDELFSDAKEPVQMLVRAKNGLSVYVKQFWLDFHPKMRREFDYVVLVGITDKRTIRRIWEQYDHLFDKKMRYNHFEEAIVEAQHAAPWTRVVIDVSLPVLQGVRPASLHWIKF